MKIEGVKNLIKEIRDIIAAKGLGDNATDEQLIKWGVGCVQKKNRTKVVNFRAMMCDKI